MTQIPTTRGAIQSSEIASTSGHTFIATLAREEIDSIFGVVNDDLQRVHGDRNVFLVGGGTLTFTGTALTFTEDLKLVFHSTESGSTVTVNLGTTGFNFTTDLRITYAIVDRTAGTFSLGDNSTVTPPLTSEKEVFVLARRVDSIAEGPRLYLRNGTALNAGDSVSLGASGSGGGGYARIFLSM